MGRLTFIFQNGRFLAFGVMLTVFSSFGQTFLISLFGGEIRGAFGLGHGEFGVVYAIATLASGGCLIWLGRQIDRFDLRSYTAAVCAGLIAACLIMSTVTSVALLVFAIFALRLTGQGLMSHTAMTSMARYFQRRRGMALSIASVGYSLGEAVLPLIVVGLIVAVGWRQTWLVMGLSLTPVLIPLMLWLLKGHGKRHADYLARVAAAPAAHGETHWSRRDMLRDPRFYLALPTVLAPAFILTGLFFHQIHLADSKGWDLTLFASGFVVYGAVHMAASLITGAAVDRLGAVPLMRVVLAPLGLSLATVAVFDQPAAIFVYFGLAAVNSGASMTIVGAVWAEI